MRLLYYSFLVILTSTIALSATHYNITSGSLHKGGSINISSKISDDIFEVTLNYKLKKRFFVPVSADKLKGSKKTKLPFEFSTEDGYLELEKLGSKKVKKAELKFLGRTSYGRYTNAYKFKIIPNNGKSTTEAIYHPQAPGIGWLNIKVTFNDILDGYTIEARIKD